MTPEIGLAQFTVEKTLYHLYHPWVSLLSQLVKNLPAVQETWVRSLCWEDPLEEGIATHSSLGGQRSLVGYSP